jgi:hypothetical protein
MQPSTPSWPDPRGKWPEFAKSMLKQILIRGRPSSAIIQQQNSSPASSQQPPMPTATFPNDPTNANLYFAGLTMASSDYDFATNSVPKYQQQSASNNNVGKNSSSQVPKTSPTAPSTASVAAFLSHAATQLFSKRTDPQDIYLDEVAFLIIADIVDLTCGPGGVAALKVNFFPNSQMNFVSSSSSSTSKDSASVLSTDPMNNFNGVNFYKQFSLVNGTRVENVASFLHGGGMNQNSMMMMMVSGSGANNLNDSGTSNTSTGAATKSAKSQMPVSSTICVVPNVNSTNTLAVYDCCTSSGLVASGAMHINPVTGAPMNQNHYYNNQSPQLQNSSAAFLTQQQQLQSQKSGAAAVAAAGDRRGRQKDNGPSLLLLDATDPTKNPMNPRFGMFANTRACERCTSDQLKALLCRRASIHALPCSVLFLFFASFQRILDQYDEMRGQQLHNNQQQQDFSFTNNAASMNNVLSRLPAGLHPSMVFLDGSGEGGGNGRWKWLWIRIAEINRILCEGKDTFAVVV